MWGSAGLGREGGGGGYHGANGEHTPWPLGDCDSRVRVSCQGLNLTMYSGYACL